MVPPIALFLLNHPMVKDYDLSSLTNCLIGGAPVEEGVTKLFEKQFPHILLTQGKLLINTSGLQSFIGFQVLIQSIVYNTSYNDIYRRDGKTDTKRNFFC